MDTLTTELIELVKATKMALDISGVARESAMFTSLQKRVDAMVEQIDECVSIPLDNFMLCDECSFDTDSAVCIDFRGGCGFTKCETGCGKPRVN